MNKHTIETIPRNTTSTELYKILTRNASIDLHETITDCFFLRDHRNGRGERKLGRKAFNWIADQHPVLFLRLLPFIAVYGRWDDLFYINSTNMKPFIYEFIKNQINTDHFQMTIGSKITTCAKWLPTEGKSFARHHKDDFALFLKTLCVTPKQYRMRITTLRKYLGIVEHHLCSGKAHLLDKKTLTKGSKRFYQKSLHNRNSWIFPLSVSSNTLPGTLPTFEKKQERKTYSKNAEIYSDIVNDLKTDDS